MLQPGYYHITMNPKFLIHLLAGVLLLTSCSQEPEICPPVPSCDFTSLIESGMLVESEAFCLEEPFPQQPPIGFTFVNDSIEYELIAASPNNSFEIAYVKKHVGFGGWAECWTINLCTNEKHLLLPGRVKRADWGRNDWLVFGYTHPAEGINIYKIKANGDSLIRLTEPDYGDSRPQWSQDESKIYFETSRLVDPNLGRMTANGDSIEPIPIGPPGSPLEIYELWGGFVWSPNDSLAIVPGNTSVSTFYFNVNTLKMDNIIPASNILGNSFQWSSNGASVYWHDRYGVYQTDIMTKQRDTILVGVPHCTNAALGKFHVPEQHDWIYWTHHSYTPIGGTRLFVDSEIRMTDLKTGEHWVVNLE